MYFSVSFILKYSPHLDQGRLVVTDPSNSCNNSPQSVTADTEMSLNMLNPDVKVRESSSKDLKCI